MDISQDTVLTIIANAIFLYGAVTTNKTDIKWLKEAVKEIKAQIK
ncbi:hypothetical protein [Pseudoalteromonas aurantia]|uniref:Uncharacterized protein n=1 Tax=Pseudoalteromonas aurantia 208 TaxID=1314867 RepID=A0ABR9EE18_9GAMM|nr:hypothetical protein [Pseudoalteromonas aurantia]MBE0369220.1 hypothetical protein [Pseudoalteromonas aurantia 208]